MQKGNPVAVAIWISGAVITLVHLSAPFPYDDYQVPLFPLLAAALAAALVGVVTRGDDEKKTVRASAWLLVTVFLASVFAAGASPMNMDWFIRGRDRIWWRMKDEPALSKLHECADLLRFAYPGASELLTQDAYLAIEAGMKVPCGLEMGPFSYFPNFPDERAKALHVVNKNGLREILRTSAAPVAAISGYGLSISCPEVSELTKDEQRELQTLLESRYDFVNEEPSFGQGSTTLKIYKLRGTRAAL